MPHIIRPGDPEWNRLITASKVPGILGVSPYTDAYTVYHTMLGNLPPFGGNRATERGTYLEPAAIAWFADQHPDLKVTPNTSTLFHRDRPTWACTPDALLDDYGIVEAKTAQYPDAWGTPHTAEVPTDYLAQCAFQIIVTRAHTVHIPVIFGQPFEFREYRVTADDVADLVPGIETAIERFEAALHDGEEPLPIGPAAYDTLRAMHPDIDRGATVTVPDDVAAQYVAAIAAAKATEAALKDAKAMLAHHMGTAQKAVWGGTEIASRISKGGGAPYVQAARTLPTVERTAA